MSKETILFPVGRLVGGSLYTAKDKDAEGKPLTIKSGPDAGKPRVDYYFAVAYEKAGTRAWWETEWGAKIMQVGAKAFPQAYQAPTFAWKIKDGDSTIPNRAGNKPCDNEGWPGHWVVFFSSSFKPRIYNADGTAPIVDEGAVKPGYFVQVFGNVDGNNSAQQPGVYINHSMVAFAGYGPEISLGADASAVGFGKAALPAGVMAAPAGGMAAPPVMGAPGAAVPGLPAMPGAAPMMAAPAVPGMPAMPGAAPAMAAPAMTPVAPAPGFVAAAAGAPVPGMPAMPGAAPVMAPPAAPVRQLTAKANGYTYEQLIAGGWTDATLIANGLMAA